MLLQLTNSLYTTIMYLVKTFSIIFLTCFLMVKPGFGEEKSPNDFVSENYWELAEPVLRCKAVHEYVKQEVLDYGFMLGFFRNTDQETYNNADQFLRTLVGETDNLDLLLINLKKIALPEEQYTVEESNAIKLEMYYIEQERLSTYYVEWYQRRSISPAMEFHEQMKQAIAWCIGQRVQWESMIDSNFNTESKT